MRLLPDGRVIRLATGSHKNVKAGISPARVESFRRRFVGIRDDDVEKLRQPSSKRSDANKGTATCEHCGGSVRRQAEFVVTDIWEHIPIDARWMTAARLVYQRDDLVIGELRVYPRDEVDERSEELGEPGIWSAELLGKMAHVPHGGLRARLLQKVRLRHAQVRSGLLRLLLESNPELFEPSGRLHALGMKKPKRREVEASRRARPDYFYAVLAAEYVQAMAGDPRRPVVTVAKRRDLPVSRVRDMLHTARARELLSPGVQGCSGGGLTARAKELLGEAAKKPTRRGKKSPREV